MIVAVVGTGSVGRRHLANLRRLGHDVVAVRRDPAAGLELDGEAVTCVGHLGAAIATGAEAVVVASPTARHEDDAVAALRAGLDVYLEKPATPTADRCAALAALADDAGRTVAVGHQLRFHPTVEALAGVLASGRLGRVLAVHADWVEHLADYHPDEDYRTSYAARRELGGGVLLTQIHLPDLLHHLLGPFRSVLAVGGHLSDLEVDVDDSVTFLAALDHDVAVTAHLDYLGRPKRSTIEVTGTHGRARADLVTAELVVQGAEPDAAPEVARWTVDRNDLFVATLADFLAARTEGRAPRTALADAVAVLRATDAIRTSMEQRGAVVVPAR